LYERKAFDGGAARDCDRINDQPPFYVDFQVAALDPKAP
jgi:hypothetical protein